MSVTATACPEEGRGTFPVTADPLATEDGNAREQQPERDDLL